VGFLAPPRGWDPFRGGRYQGGGAIGGRGGGEFWGRVSTGQFLGLFRVRIFGGRGGGEVARGKPPGLSKGGLSGAFFWGRGARGGGGPIPPFGGRIDFEKYWKNFSLPRGAEEVGGAGPLGGGKKIKKLGGGEKNPASGTGGASGETGRRQWPAEFSGIFSKGPNQGGWGGWGGETKISECWGMGANFFFFAQLDRAPPFSKKNISVPGLFFPGGHKKVESFPRGGRGGPRPNHGDQKPSLSLEKGSENICRGGRLCPHPRFGLE